MKGGGALGLPALLQIAQHQVRRTSTTVAAKQVFCSHPTAALSTLGGPEDGPSVASGEHCVLLNAIHV